jgi:hypothetical protein
MADSNETQRLAGSVDPHLDAVRKELDKILSSAAFQRSERRSNFLRYTVERTILGRGDLIKELVPSLLRRMRLL